jgi:asparagine synthase (glutamine-hydrolysing)
MLAGYLRRAGREVRAVTWGRRTDDDVALARRVARAAGIAHRVRPDGAPGELPAAAERTARFEHGAGGFTTLTAWGLGRWLDDLPATVVNGYAYGNALGGGSLGWAAPDDAFEGFFARINAWGIPPDRLRALLPGARYAGVVDEVLERARETYAGYGGGPGDRAWCFDLQHRQRFHTCGMAWRQSFHAWPAQPAVDRAALDAAGRLPRTALAERRAQDTILRLWFPALAALPVDNNDGDPRPLLWPLRAKLVARARRAWRRARPGVEHRRYYRIYDFDGAGWRAVRRRVEPLRPLGEELFDAAALRRELPPPDSAFGAADAVVDSAGAKSLLGVLLWRERVGAV